MKQPLVSIIIPVYNGSNYVREAIDSALAQTYPHKEIIVVNDGSTDGGATEEIILSYGDRVQYVKKENGGVSSALNAGIQAMHGEYFSWLSHDDTYMPAKIETQVSLLNGSSSESVIVMCANQHIDKNSAPLGKPRFSELPSRESVGWEGALSFVMQYSCNGCTLLIPRSAFEECGGFHEGLRYSQDFLMWTLLFIHKYSLLYHDDVLVGSRVHDRQLTQTGRSLFLHDGAIVARILAPQLAAISSPDHPFLYAFAKTNAVHYNGQAVDACMEEAKKAHVFTVGQRLKLRFCCLYGRIRPTIRRIYYKTVKRVKTQ